ncbi:tripartite tricarboxylate transporter substrate binding protein [Psychrobacillus sp. NPDC096389]|uniref:tripartite tricarboxylate transporter substrate binding protein n=1 Tax=Psychrobacillus sp. NPDC096389 TaxID=3364490 RepID=UPI0037F7BFA7
MRKFNGIWFFLVLTFLLVACSDKTEPTEVEASDSTETSAPVVENTSTYPEKPITMVAPSGAGGSWDIAARSIVSALEKTSIVTEQMSVENVPGGSGAVFMATYATKDIKDDYKVFVNSPSLLINNLRSEANSPYGHKDTTPLAQLFQDYGVIAVQKDSPYNDLPSLLEDLKNNPSKLSIGGGSSAGSMWHLNFALSAYNEGVDITKLKYVPFSGNGESMTALLGKHVDVLSSGASDVAQYLKAGEIKVLALNAPKRLDGDFADVPTLQELNINGDFSIWRGVFGPKEMSTEAKDYWNDALKQLSETPEWQQEMKSNGWEPAYLDADSFKTALDEQNETILEVLKVMEMAQ